MIDKKIAHALEAQAQITNKDNHLSTSTMEQRNRLLEWLRNAPITTLVARRQLDILGVAARINELRKAGYPIVTLWTNEETDCGIKHRIALYVLRSGGQVVKN
jgi:Helix-turn-helix domain